MSAQAVTLASDGKQYPVSTAPGAASIVTLGDAATLNVGTTPGTIAAGDHDHAGVYQPLDADLTSLAGVGLTAAGLALLDDANAAAQRGTLGLGNAATLSVGSSGGTVAAGDDARFPSAIAASTYSPALTNVTNLDASTGYAAQYLRINNIVIVSGKVDVDPTAAGAVELGISLPVASNFANAQDCGGVAFSPGIAGQGAAILADATNDRASMQWVAVDTSNQTMAFSFMYRVI